MRCGLSFSFSFCWFARRRAEIRIKNGKFLSIAGFLLLAACRVVNSDKDDNFKTVGTINREPLAIHTMSRERAVEMLLQRTPAQLSDSDMVQQQQAVNCGAIRGKIVKYLMDRDKRRFRITASDQELAERNRGYLETHDPVAEAKQQQAFSQALFQAVTDVLDNHVDPDEAYKTLAPFKISELFWSDTLARARTPEGRKQLATQASSALNAFRPPPEFWRDQMEREKLDVAIARTDPTFKEALEKFRADTIRKPDGSRSGSYSGNTHAIVQAGRNAWWNTELQSLDIVLYDSTLSAACKLSNGIMIPPSP